MSELIAPVAATPVSAMLASPVTVSAPNAVVPARPVSITALGSFQAPEPHVLRAQPDTEAIKLLRYSYNSVTCICGWKCNRE